MTETHRILAMIERDVVSQITRRGVALNVTAIAPVVLPPLIAVVCFSGGELAEMEAARLIRLLTNTCVKVAVMRDTTEASYAFFSDATGMEILVQLTSDRLVLIALHE